MGFFKDLWALLGKAQHEIDIKTGNFPPLKMTCKEYASAIASRAEEVYGYDNVLIVVGRNSFGEKHVQVKIKVNDQWHWAEPFAAQSLDKIQSEWFAASGVKSIKEVFAEMTIDQYELGRMEPRYRRRQDKHWDSSAKKGVRSIRAEDVGVNDVMASAVSFLEDL